ncbi:MAG: DUF4388 domain-containing protein [Deltaproteobacteria bacterium]|nr:DUF4388 domain-containing protein [Deltaproteobacteria bacterium]
MPPEVALSGRLRFLSLGEVLQTLGTTAATGELRIKSRFAKEAGVVYFSKGYPVNAKAFAETGIDALYSLFGWTDGDFEFVDGVAVSAERTINQGIMEIVMDGARLLDDDQIKVLSAETSPDGATEEAPAPQTEKAKQRPKLKGIPIIRLPIRNQQFITSEAVFERGCELVGKNPNAAFMCLILEGFANVYKKAGDDPVRMCRLGPGALSGSIPGFNTKGSALSISAVAAGSVKVGLFDAARLNADFAKLSYQLRRIFLSLDNRWVQISDLMAGTGQDGAAALISGGRTFMKQGDKGAGSFLIAEGNAVIARMVGEGHVPLARCGKGDFVGQLPFINIGHEPNAASIFVTPNFKTQPIDTDRMQAEYDLASPIVKHFVEHIANCVSVTSMVACDSIQPVV